MSKFQALAFLISASLAQGETVLWTATGALTGTTGVFLRDDLPSDTPVTIRITYDDQAIPQNRSSFPSLGASENDYRTNLNLSIVITAGSYQWEGFVGSGSTSTPTTFNVRTSNFSAETIEINIDSDDSGEFTQFPFRLAESDASIELDLRGANSNFLGFGISPSAIDPTILQTASLQISTGIGNALNASLDPSSFTILFESEEPVEPITPIPSIIINSENLSLFWHSDIRFRYQVEATSDLAATDWTVLETRDGTDTPITRTYPLSNGFQFYRVRAIQG